MSENEISHIKEVLLTSRREDVDAQRLLKLCDENTSLKARVDELEKALNRIANMAVQKRTERL